MFAIIFIQDTSVQHKIMNIYIIYK